MKCHTFSPGVIAHVSTFARSTPPYRSNNKSLGSTRLATHLGRRAAMVLLKPENRPKAGCLTVLFAGFRKKAMKVLRKKRVDNELGAFPRSDETILFAQVSSASPQHEDEDETTTSFDMSAFEEATATENSVFGADMDDRHRVRFVGREELDSDEIVLLSKSPETTKKSRRSRGSFRCSLNPLKNGWKRTAMFQPWKKDTYGNYCNAAGNTGGADGSLQSDPKWRVRCFDRSFSDWAGRKMSSSNSAEHITHNNPSSNDESISSSDFDTRKAKTGPAQFSPAKGDGLGLCTML